MTATDEVRRLLDERGVEWFESVTRKGLTWIYRDGKAIRFHPWQPNTLKVSMFDLTPEQAIAATLWIGECRRVRGRKSYRAYGGYRIECSECGYGLADKRYHFCPNCGRKIKED